MEPQLETLIVGALERAQHVVADFTAVWYVDSAVLSLLVRLRKRVLARLQIVVPAEGNVGKVFGMTKLREGLGVHYTFDQALRIIGAP